MIFSTGKYIFGNPRTSFKILIHHLLHLPVISGELSSVYISFENHTNILNSQKVLKRLQFLLNHFLLTFHVMQLKCKVADYYNKEQKNQ